MESEYQVMRVGKTQRDHESGAWARRFNNRQARVDWQHSSHPTADTFPKASCNGKRNRIR